MLPFFFIVTLQQLVWQSGRTGKRRQRDQEGKDVVFTATPIVHLDATRTRVT